MLDAGADATPRQFPARLVAVDGTRVATGRDFGAGRSGSRARRERWTRRRRGGWPRPSKAATWPSSRSSRKPYTRKPYAPFMTSTLQQEAGRKLRFSADRTMRGAQRLYENGYITYLRTDSTTLSRVGHRRRPGAGPRAVRRRLRARPAAAVHAQGQERAGGPRGHPARRGAVPHARRGGARARRRRLPPLRADLAAHGRLADGRRPRHHRQRADRGHGGHGRGRHVRGVGAHDHLPRLPQGLRRDPRRRQRRAGRRRRVPPARADAGAAARRRLAHPGGPQHQPARALHRAQPGQGAGRPRHRPPVHVRVDHQDDPGPRVRVEEGRGARAVVGGVRRGGAAGAPLRAAGRLRLHRRHGGRARRHRRPATSSAPTGSRPSTSGPRRAAKDRSRARAG